MPELRLVLNVHVEAGDYSSALEAAKPVVERVQRSARVRECRVRPYPKFDEQFSVWMELDAEAPASAFANLASDLATQWEEGGDEIDRFLIWDIRSHGDPTLPGLRWMHLNLFIAS